MDSVDHSTNSESGEDEDDEEAQTDEDGDSEWEEGMEFDVVTLSGAQTAETQIENDFEYVPIHVRSFEHCSKTTRNSVLIQNIRQSDDSGSGMLSQSWDFNLEDQEAEFREDLRVASGVGKRGRKKGQRVSFLFRASTSQFSCSPLGKKGWASALSSGQVFDWRGQPGLRGQRYRGDHPNHARGHSYRASRIVGLVCTGAMLR